MSLDGLFEALACVALEGTVGSGPRSAQLLDPLRGDWNGRGISLNTTLHAGGRGYSRVQIAHLTSDDSTMETLTIVAVPEVEVERSILGLDVVGFHGRITFFALDVHPLGGVLPTAATDALTTCRCALEADLKLRAPQPPFTALSVVGSGAATPDSVFRAAEGVIDALHASSAPGVSVPRSNERRRELALYAAEMSHHMKAVPVLNKLFGATATAHYFDEGYFSPARWGSPVEEARRDASH